MLRPLLISAGCCGLFSTLFAQPTNRNEPTDTLETVVVKAFEQNRKLIDVGAAVVVVGKSTLNRFQNFSLVSALNTQPGVRMEERSPGSYRLNIRGSSLRAPFGVRNVKVYYNDIPYTTPGGDSYFNQFGFNGISSIEVIKGPGSSLYGAGTGGVLLLQSEPKPWQEGISVQWAMGSYQSKNQHINARAGSEQFQNTFSLQNQESNGYRNQSALKRTVLSWDLSSTLSEKSKLESHFLYGDLFYETPGGLTAAEVLAAPRSARPRTGPIAGAEEARAAISQKNFFSGIRYQYKIDAHWTESVSLYGAFIRLRNPGIFNYSWANEAHTGGRYVLAYQKNQLSLQFGTELQQGFTTAKTFKNLQGSPDTLRTDDEVNTRLVFGFLQVNYTLPKGWILSGGSSINQLKTSITRLSSYPSAAKNRRYSNQWAPRLSVLKKVNSHISFYGSVSKGYSPPTTSELLPSSGIIATDLEAEQGTNVELGSRGTLAQSRFSYDVNAFYFALKNAIVIRRDNLGRDYFVNAGQTRQLGLETQVSYWWNKGTGALWSTSRMWVSHTGYGFRYKNFVKGNLDYSGKQLPSVPRQNIVVGIDAQLKSGFYANITYTYTDPIPLNDANTSWSSAMHLLGVRAGYKKILNRHVRLELFVSGDNLTNTNYSLGYDLNANGGRYFNPAPRRNVVAGLTLDWLK